MIDVERLNGPYHIQINLIFNTFLLHIVYFVMLIFHEIYNKRGNLNNGMKLPKEHIIIKILYAKKLK